ncbi:FGGY carbohydrate kinase domain-containing protein-like [Tropilaelaps mercedesae]|uniref:FGGY carbohydrate kinase domain-containing protein-like n=1 Tax=Tropilaelaps mercedesae TaxID=418985 RepID=A0A1V9X2S9_9ACAR|nr:FGGY carbohydrate kinase domain-containing protein-like [Tropilaelaps mercedesae]
MSHAEKEVLSCTNSNGHPTVPSKPSINTNPASSGANGGSYNLQLRNLLPAKRLQMATSFVVGVDVGSRSARAALVTLKGNLLRKAERPLEVREAKGEIFEQSGEQIWNAVCECVREVISSVSVDDIKGIGFDATCSLVITDATGKPVSVSADGDDRFNVIMWCDHRACVEAELINREDHQVLCRVGGRISPEMEPPKLLWLKRHMPQSFQRMKHAFDLPDYLTYRATGSLSRSLCSLSCKWTYDPRNGWDKIFWTEIGLNEVADRPEVIGVWGPYEGAILPQLYLAEAGQSATGMLLDHLLSTHGHYQTALVNSKRFGIHIVQYVTQILENLASSKRCSVDELTKDLHIYPDFHGNRSPLADSNMRGMVSGLQLSSSEDNLALLFLAGVQALAYQTKHIIERLEEKGHRIESLLLCGGLVKNPLYVAAHANVLQLPVLVPEENEAVLLGSAVLGACASGCFENLRESMREMSGRATALWPNRALAQLHAKRYKAFLALLDCQVAIRNIMEC